MEYIDLLLIHEPTGNVHEIYRAMETAYKDGKLRAIGISNFLEERYLDLINHCKVIPAVNQVETHVFRQQKKLRQLECQIGTKHESWSPLACGQNGIFTNQILLEISKAHGKTVAQTALRFLYQQGIVVIPKSTHTPIYYFGMSAQLKMFIDRFYSFTTELSSKGMKTALITAAWDTDDEAVAYLREHYQKICRYMHFQDQGMILGTGCGTPDMTRHTDFPKRAYELGKSIMQ